MQLRTLLPTPHLLQGDYLVASDVMITLVARTCRPETTCPSCGRTATRVQSRSMRTLADLPWQGIPVRLQLRLRCFFCDQPDCATAIFTERLPALVGHYCRRTCRQAQTLDQIGYALGGEAGARLAATLGISISADTLKRRLHDRRPRGGAAPRVLGVDDWALRKGHHYGTILVDLEAGRPVDLLSDRQGETLATWLKEHPGVEVVVRDRGGAYAEGARAGAPQAVQVADRFHLLKNLVEALEATLAQEQPALQEAARAPFPPSEPAITTTELSDPAAAVPADGRPGPPPRVAQQQAQRREQKRAVYEEMLRLRAAGCSQLAIARQVGRSLRTVHRYLRSPAFPERKSRTRPPGQLAPYRAYLEQRWREGCQNANSVVARTARARLPRFLLPCARVSGGVADPTSARAASLERPEAAARRGFGGTDVGGGGVVAAGLSGEAVDRAGGLSGAVDHAAPGDRAAAALEPWRERVATSGIAELQRFSAGLQRDWDAVVAGLTLEWSTGPVEGQINRLKMLKRQIYGRAGVSLLRARVLPPAATA